MLQAPEERNVLWEKRILHSSEALMIFPILALQTFGPSGTDKSRASNTQLPHYFLMREERYFLNLLCGTLRLFALA